MKSNSYIQLCRFESQSINPKLQETIKDTIFMRRHKKIVIEKPEINTSASDKQWFDINKLTNSTKFYYNEQQAQDKNNIILSKNLDQGYNIKMIERQYQQSMDKKQSKNKQQKRSNQVRYKDIKHKIIRKIQSQSINKKKQKQLHKQYCRYLTGYLHQSNRILIQKNIPPSLSILQTADDGDYLEQEMRKDYPHYSNAIQVIDLPRDNTEVRHIRQPVKISFADTAFNVQQNIVFKFKIIGMFISKLFDDSIQYQKKIRYQNILGDKSMKAQDQDHDFQRMSEALGITRKASKLLYDLMNDYFDLEKQLASDGNSEQKKAKTCKEIKSSLQYQIQNLFEQKIKSQSYSQLYSAYVPIKQCYLSLKDLRLILSELYSN